MSEIFRYFSPIKHYQRVMNISNTLSNLEINAVDAFHDFLARVPNIEVSSVERELTLRPDYRIDARIGFGHGGVSYALIVEAKKNGAPRFVRSAIHHLKSYLTHMHQFVHEHVGPRLIPMIVSPYLFPESRSICTNHNVAYLDLVGNARFTLCILLRNGWRRMVGTAHIAFIVTSPVPSC